MKYQLPETESGKDVWQLAREISLSAGEILLDWWPKAKEVSDEGQNDIVTNVDRECEAHIRSAIKAHFPEHGIFGEEENGDEPTTGWTWIVDPIDGTQNYAWGIPCFSTVIAIAKDGEVEAGVNFDAINITLGLPFLRISPDHGPNKEMLGKNLSNPLSLTQSIKFLDKK